MKKKIFALTLCLIFILAALCVQFVSALPETNDCDMSQQSRSIDEYRKILDAVNREKDNSVQSDSLGEDLADVYAGAYINGDNLLVINVTNATDGIKEEIKSASGNPDVIINEVEFSSSEIDKAYEKLVVNMENAPYFKVTVSEKDNTVYITGENSEDCNRYILENGYNSEMITVVEGQNTVEDCASVYAGGYLFFVEQETVPCI